MRNRFKLKLHNADPELFAAPSFKPNMASLEFAPLVFKDVDESVKVHAKTLMDAGWSFYAVSQTRGRCYMREKVITIPIWVIKKNTREKVWYIAHEIAHAMDKCQHDHGPEFMGWLIRICPQDCVHYELGYKPRNAAMAGIVDPNKKPAPVDWNKVDWSKVKL